MNFRLCLNCKKTSWFDISFKFFRIKEDQLIRFPDECKRFNVEKGDVLITFKPEIHCDFISGEYYHPGLDLDWLLNRFYFKHPEYMKIALLKKYFVKKNKIKISELEDCSASMFLKPRENKTYYVCDVEPAKLRDILLDYMKLIENKLFPSDGCRLGFEHIVFGGEL